MPTFSEDEMKVECGGSRYVAKPSDLCVCKGCAFINGFGCTLAEAIYRENPAKPLHATKCHPRGRHDEKHIIWVPAHTVKEKS